MSSESSLETMNVCFKFDGFGDISFRTDVANCWIDITSGEMEVPTAGKLKSVLQPLQLFIKSLIRAVSRDRPHHRPIPS